MSKPQVTRRSYWQAVLATCLLIAAGTQFGHGAYILGKAELAQFLITRAWNDNQHNGAAVAKPWAWADTSPVARLQFVRQHESMIVLSGDSGRILAFGPGHNVNTPLPGTGGNSVISGHRDTHFSILRDVVPGDSISLQTVTGITLHYEVQSMQVVDKSRIDITGDNGYDEISLVTCWPFDALAANGPERLVISARRVPMT
ncbi:MAG: class GN sortase [Burkholderiaceae bacterium]